MSISTGSTPISPRWRRTCGSNSPPITSKPTACRSSATAICATSAKATSSRSHIPAGTLGQKQLDDVWSRFHEAHKREYGHYFADNPIEIVNIRVMGIGHMPKIDKLTAPQGTTLTKARVKTGQCAFRINGELRPFETVFYRRHLLPVGETFAGPAIVLQKDSTTVIPPGCTATNDAAGNLILKVAGDAR